ncbi:ATP-dependent translocase ABCB1 [Pristis pectinata]|uniref:ATP-dependent translocase ABCB1 n=1 Tax=Pristis pectinata TaxID=685728 RepID=UPI00223D72AF|nr:ATP-dependent translocase ABCB1 [Pristis pectinata]
MTRFAYYFVALGCAVLILGTIHVSMFSVSGIRQTRRIRQKFFHAIIHQEMAWFDSHQIGELNARLTDDIKIIKEGLSDKPSIVIQLFTTFVTGFIIGLSYGWKLTLVILSVSPFLMASVVMWTKFITSLTNAELKAYAKASAVCEEVLMAIRTVFAFSGQQKALAKYKANLKQAKELGVKKSVITYASIGLSELLIYGSYALAFWYGSKLVVDEPENYTVGQILIILFSVLTGAFSVGQGLANFEGVSKAQGAAYEIYHLIAKYRPIDSSSNDGHKLDSIEGDVEFKDIHFSYPTRPDSKILNGLNVKVARGQTIALVGASGCGKSTTIQLLQRFYDPQAGQITLDGHDIRTLNVKWLREHIGVVSQEPILFATTIAENIGYGRQDATDEEIEQAAREANAYDFISMLPDKFNTIVGERGTQLSGGQKQRIAIARAIVRDPKILLLDEATSALDTQSESIVQTALDKARAGRTTIVIAHRLSTISSADIIAAFSNGVVSEQGTHSQLMDKKGIYYSLVKQQSSTQKSDSVEETGDALEKVNELEDDEVRSIHMISRNSFRRKSSKKLQHFASTEPKETEGNNEEENKLEEDLPEVSFLRVLALNETEWPYIVFGILSSIISGGIPVGFGVVFSRIIRVFAIIDPELKQWRAAILSLIFLGLGILTFLCYCVQGYTFGKSGENLTMRLRGLSFKAILQQEIGWFDDQKNAVGVLTTRLATDASQVKGAAGIQFGIIVKNSCTLGAAIIVSFVFGWQLTLVILCSIPFLIGANFIAMRTYSGLSSNNNTFLEISGQISAEAVENIRTIASLTREDVFFKRYMDSIDQPVRVFTVILMSAMQIGQTSSFAPDYAKAKVSAQRIMQLLHRKSLIDSYSEEGEKLSNFEGNIEFQNVEFVYPTQPDVKVLQGLNIQINKGQTLALVGSSGCGKSTLVQLLERFYDVIGGQVLVDGKDTRSLNLSWLRQQMGIVFQEPLLFDCSIAENIAYGDNSKAITQEEIEEAAKAANIHSFIESLPEGYNTKAGDKGTQLSGGQKQRIAIARALIRKPKVLILDEATSALDNESEKIVQKALDEARQGRTCLIIAHRLSTIQNADSIAVIQNGNIVEIGTHNQLLAKEGVYHALVHAQLHN